MNSVTSDNDVLILAPFGEDAHMLSRVAEQQGLSSRVAQSPSHFLSSVQRGFGVLLLTEEALDGDLGDRMATFTERQPDWAVSPLLALVDNVELPPVGLRQLQRVDPKLDLVLLERPARSRSVGSALRTMMRGRYRQYEVRDNLVRLVEQRMKLDSLLGEFDRRIDKILSTVQNMMTLAHEQSEGSPAFVAAFGDRVQALAAAQRALVGDFERQLTLRQLVERVIQQSPELGGRNVRVDGPEVRLWPYAAMTMALFVQELLSNAMRHGSLSAAGGSLLINWDVLWGDDRILVFKWRELGGPAPLRPARPGYGLRFIEKLAPEELGGRTELSFLPSGVTCIATIPLPE